MDPCPVIREPLSGARDRTTLGQTSAPIIVLTVQLYTWKWTVHATACTLRVLKIPQNFSNHPFLFSSRNYALTISSIKFPKFKIFVVGMVKIGMENNKILRKRRIVEDVEGMENVSFIIRRIRGTTRSTVYKIRNTLCSRVYACAHLETRIDAHAYVYGAVIIRFRCVKGDVVKMGSRTNGFVYNTTLFPYETSSPVFLVRRFFVLAFDLASSRGIPASNIGWNWMERQRGHRVSVWKRFKGAPHAFVDAKQDAPSVIV